MKYGEQITYEHRARKALKGYADIGDVEMFKNIINDLVEHEVTSPLFSVLEEVSIRARRYRKPEKEQISNIFREMYTYCSYDNGLTKQLETAILRINQ